MKHDATGTTVYTNTDQRTVYIFVRYSDDEFRQFIRDLVGANYTVIQRPNKREILAGPVPWYDYGHLNATIYAETNDFAGAWRWSIMADEKQRPVWLKDVEWMFDD